MKVTIKRIGGGPVRFTEFARRNGLEMEVHERGGETAGKDNAYYAHFSGVEVMERGMLCGTYGNGVSPALAIAAYAHELRGRRIVYGAYASKRREVDCPTEWLPEAKGERN